MKILVKLPTRERAEKAVTAIRRAANRSKGVKYVLTLDQDDYEANKQTYHKAYHLTDKGGRIDVDLHVGSSISKIHACNRDMDKVKEWDVMVLLSDDMICVADRWDEIIKSHMNMYFSDLDGVLHYNDGFTGKRLNTMCILGRKYYERFGYIYHESYQSLFCDDEFTQVSKMLKKTKYHNIVLFEHRHPANNSRYGTDRLYNFNMKLYHADKENYMKRLAKNFDL